MSTVSLENAFLTPGTKLEVGDELVDKKVVVMRSKVHLLFTMQSGPYQKVQVGGRIFSVSHCEEQREALRLAFIDLCGEGCLLEREDIEATVFFKEPETLAALHCIGALAPDWGPCVSDIVEEKNLAGDAEPHFSDYMATIRSIFETRGQEGETFRGSNGTLFTFNPARVNRVAQMVSILMTPYDILSFEPNVLAELLLIRHSELATLRNTGDAQETLTAIIHFCRYGAS